MSLLVSESLVGLLDEEELLGKSLDIKLRLGETVFGDVTKVKFVNSRVEINIVADVLDLVKIFKIKDSDTVVSVLISDNFFDIGSGNLILNCIELIENSSLFDVKLTTHE